MANQPECARLLTQTEDSLRAIRLHLTNYQLQLLQLTLRKPVKISYLPKDLEDLTSVAWLYARDVTKV